MFRPARQMKFHFLENQEVAGTAVRQVPEFSAGLVGDDLKLTKICVKQLRDLGLVELADRVSVEWNRRMRSCAGRASWPAGQIQLNPNLANISKAEIKQTVLHELAHLIAYERNPHRKIKSHGREWRKACADVGIPGEKATHDLSLPSRTMRRQWRYECPACHQAFERVRRFKGAVACYECCRKVTGGAYEESFRLREVRLV